MDSRSQVFEPFRYSDFVETNNPIISFPDEYYNGTDESSTDNPSDFVVVTVNAGQTTQNINFITNDSGPPPPPLLCQSPPLNTDFSDIGVFFVDLINAVLIGITSNGEVVTILLSDIPDSGVTLGLLGIPISATVCEIMLGTFDLLETSFGATGECRLEENSTVFVIEDLFLVGIPFGEDFRGECFAIASFAAQSESLNSLNKAMLDKLQQMTDRQITREEKGLILDFHADIIQNQEE